MAPRIQKTRIVQTDDGKFALVDGYGQIVRSGFRSKQLAAICGKRHKIYEGTTPSKRKTHIPPELEDLSIKPTRLLAEMTGESHWRFMIDARAGRYGELYPLGRGHGLQFGNWKRGLATRAIKVAAE